jgi:hypothetical protein
MHLQAPPGSSLLVRGALDLILAAHIGGGAVGMVSGAAALLAPKGGPLHRAAGNVFFVAMLVMAGIGATVAPIMGDWISTFAGFFTLYIVVTAWATVRRKDGGVGGLETGGLFVALSVVAAGLFFIWLQSRSSTGMIDGTPPQAAYIFAIIGSIAAAGDLKMILRGGICGAQRIARHLWRMCFGLFIAAGSFFLGQSQVFPASLRHSPILMVPPFAVLGALIFWMLRVRLARRPNNVAMAA